MEKDHELVERGPFRIMRPPSYTGMLLAFVGFALSLRNWAALLVVLLPIGAAFVHRMNVEEKALSRAFGSRYTDYMRRHQTACAVRLLKWCSLAFVLLPPVNPSLFGQSIVDTRRAFQLEWRFHRKFLHHHEKEIRNSIRLL